MPKQDETHRYDDIINLPHHVSSTHIPMSMEQRAAQFSPFAALTDYENYIAEAERLTDRRPELDEEEIALLDQKLRRIESLLPDAPSVTITRFVPDEKKEGGAYIPRHGRVKRIDHHRRIIQIEDQTEIPIDDILSIEGIES